MRHDPAGDPRHACGIKPLLFSFGRGAFFVVAAGLIAYGIYQLIFYLAWRHGHG